MSSISPVAALIAGAMAAGYGVVGLFFVRFWSRTRDSLFLAFAIAFALLAVGQVLPVLYGLPRQHLQGVFLLRLAGFSLIIVAIVGKNLGGDGPR